MKITSRDKELICLVLSIGIVAASWFLGAKNIEKKTEEMTGRKSSGRNTMSVSGFFSKRMSIFKRQRIITRLIH